MTEQKTTIEQVAAHFGIEAEAVSPALLAEIKRGSLPARPDKFCGACAHFAGRRGLNTGECRLRAPRAGFYRWPSISRGEFCGKFEPATPSNEVEGGHEH